MCKVCVKVVDTTVHSAVEEYLFGPVLTLSSTESDVKDDTVSLVGAVNEINHVYPSVKDRNKRLNESNLTPPKKSQIQKKDDISVEDFNFIEENSSVVLITLKQDRTQPLISRPRPSISSRTSEDAEAPIIDQAAIKSHFVNHRDNDFKDYFKSPNETLENLSTTLESESGKELVDQKNENAQTEIGGSIPLLDINHFQDEEVFLGEAIKSPRGRSYQFDFDEPIRSPHSASLPPDLNEYSHFNRKEDWDEKSYSYRQDTMPIVEMSPQDLRKRILALKKIVSNFENDFEAKNGRQPMSSDKTRIQKDIAKLRRAKKQYREHLTEAGQNEKNKHLSLSPDSDKNSKNRYNNTILSNGTNRSQNEDHFSSTLNELEDDTFAITKRLQTTRPDAILPPIDSERSIDEAILHNATISELLEHHQNAKRVKKRLVKIIKDFEEEFYTAWNRKPQKDDRIPKESAYQEYKLIKSKLRLVEALITKKAANQTM